MAHIDPIPAGPVAGIAEPHQGTVATILRAVELGLFTAAEADMLIDRVRAHVTPVPGAAAVPVPTSVDVVFPPRRAGARGLLPHSLDRTV